MQFAIYAIRQTLSDIGRGTGAVVRRGRPRTANSAGEYCLSGRELREQFRGGGIGLTCAREPADDTQRRGSPRTVVVRPRPLLHRPVGLAGKPRCGRLPSLFGHTHPRFGSTVRRSPACRGTAGSPGWRDRFLPPRESVAPSAPDARADAFVTGIGSPDSSAEYSAPCLDMRIVAGVAQIRLPGHPDHTKHEPHEKWQTFGY